MNFIAYIGLSVVVFYLIPDELYRNEFWMRVGWCVWCFSALWAALHNDFHDHKRDK